MTATISRGSLVHRGRQLAGATVAWNAIEGGIASGIVAGSVALAGFGVDSYVEVFVGGVILWRLGQESHGQHVSEAHDLSVGWC